jgi:hypothetical protein
MGYDIANLLGSICVCLDKMANRNGNMECASIAGIVLLGLCEEKVSTTMKETWSDKLIRIALFVILYPVLLILTAVVAIESWFRDNRGKRARRRREKPLDY